MEKTRIAPEWKKNQAMPGQISPLCLSIPPFSSSSPHKSRKLLVWSFQLFPSKWQIRSLSITTFKGQNHTHTGTHTHTHTITHCKDPITCVWSLPHHLKWTGHFKGLTQLFILSVPFIWKTRVHHSLPGPQQDYTVEAKKGSKSRPLKRVSVIYVCQQTRRPYMHLRKSLR